MKEQIAISSQIPLTEHKHLCELKFLRLF